MRSLGLMALMLLPLGQPRDALAAAPPADPENVTTTGEINPTAPPQLRQFSFIVGTWTGVARSVDAQGKVTEYPMQWIGRYILDGTAIADEMRATSLPGNPVMGISFRTYDAKQGNWVIEFLNIPSSFLRRQVGRNRGEVRQEGSQVIVLQPAPEGALGRERYEVRDPNHFTYRMDNSKDGGRTWGDVQVTIEMERQPAPRQ